ncbi:hypothetical protein [Intestinirhabdus alba]|uniref:hypothetical protein n=1 Tax=Intestinirhabdus alba TaxID=2899544 RepID=UPI001E5CBC5D|nr:hypothetical protein [Intestinirhabdus alba]
MKFSKWLVLLLSITAGYSTIARAIEVFPIIKDIKEETPRDNYITVKSMFHHDDRAEDNSSESQQYEFVTIDLFHIKNPGEAKEDMEKVLAAENPELVFSPTKLIIPYGEERKIRIMPMRSVDHETVYRLRVRPSYPEQALEKGKVRFAIGYDVLIRYLPAGKHTQKLEISCDKNQWHLKATGNVRSELRKMVIDGRIQTGSFNVYPEHSRTLKVNHRLAFEMDGKMQVYEQCQRKE